MHQNGCKNICKIVYPTRKSFLYPSIYQFTWKVGTIESCTSRLCALPSCVEKSLPDFSLSSSFKMFAPMILSSSIHPHLSMLNTSPGAQSSLGVTHPQLHVSSFHNRPVSRQACRAGLSLHWHAHSSGRKCCAGEQLFSERGQEHAHLMCSVTSNVAHSLSHAPELMPHLDSITGIWRNLSRFSFICTAVID